MTRAQLLDAALAERFGPVERPPAPDPDLIRQRQRVLLTLPPAPGRRKRKEPT